VSFGSYSTVGYVWVNTIYGSILNVLIFLPIDYDWTELWTATIGLLNFVSSRTDELHTTGGLELLVSEVMFLYTMLRTFDANGYARRSGLSTLPSVHQKHTYHRRMPFTSSL